MVPASTKKVLLFLTTALILSSCAPLPQEAPLQIPVVKQEKEAEKKYLQLLETTARMPRKEKNDILVNGFREVMEKYPDSSFAEESHYHLMKIYLYNYDSPREAQAEEVFERYFRESKNPRMGNTINLEMAKFYYQYARWEKLISFTTPFLREYIKTGKIKDGLYLFYYSESKYQLKDYTEALRGYVTYADMYRNNKMKGFIKKRLKEIDHILEQKKDAR